MKVLSQIFFWLTGWKVVGELPKLKKYVVIVAPHTSGWDMLYGMAAKFIFGIQFSYFAKQEIFRPPFGVIFRAMGGIPVDRSAKHNLVDQAVETFNQRQQFVLALSPEGTRGYVAKWKSGFYYIALNAKVPIVLSFLDYERKQAGIGPTFYPSGDIDKDVEEMKKFYRPIKGYHPEKGVL